MQLPANIASFSCCLLDPDYHQIAIMLAQLLGKWSQLFRDKLTVYLCVYVIDTIKQYVDVLINWSLDNHFFISKYVSRIYPTSE